jgi:hypothetical protein
VLIVEDYKRSNGSTESCIILARNKASGLYTDFGGAYATKHGELSVTAVSELREESRNLLNVSPLKLKEYVDIPAGNDMYRAFIIKINGISRK